MYKNPRCGNSHMSMPLQALTVRTSLCTCKYSQVCIFQITVAFEYKPTVCNSHMSVPLQALTVRTSLFTCKYSQVYMFQITDTLVYKPIVCKLTYVCALASAHTSNLFVYMHTSTNIHISYDGHFCTRTHGADTHICLCPCERSQLEPLCVHKYSQVYIFQITVAFVYKPTVWKLTYVYALASAHS